MKGSRLRISQANIEYMTIDVSEEGQAGQPNRLRISKTWGLLTRTMATLMKMSLTEFGQAGPNEGSSGGYLTGKRIVIKLRNHFIGQM